MARKTNIFLGVEPLCFFNFVYWINFISIQASPITMGGRPAVVEEKKSNSRGMLAFMMLPTNKIRN